MILRQIQHGTTLVEVLVAAVVIGIGLLGIAALQIKAMQASTDAEHRARATDIAWTLADRMRANLLANTGSGQGYDSDPISTCPTPDSIPNCAMAAGAETNNATSCTPAEMAEFDLYEVRCAPDIGVKRVLPDGRLTVDCGSCDAGSEFQITISWSTRDNPQDTEEARDAITMTVIPGTAP